MNKETYNLTDVYYSIYENGLPFGITYTTKEEAIRVYLEAIEEEEKIDTEYWREHAKKHREALRSGNVQVKKTIREIYVTEYLETIEEGV